MDEQGSNAFGLDRIGQIAVTVHDVPQAVAFYRDVLGMQFLSEAANMAFFQCGDIRLMLGVPEAPELDHPASVIYYSVDDIPKAYETLTSRGVLFETPPHLVAKMGEVDLWMGFFRDVDGNLLALMSEVPTSN